MSNANQAPHSFIVANGTRATVVTARAKKKDRPPHVVIVYRGVGSKAAQKRKRSK